MNLRNWREWFIRSEDEVPAHVEEEAVRVTSGAGHLEETTFQGRKKLPPRCASCKQFIGFETGLHLMISEDWRVHVSCFTKVLERHYENGEVIDLTTGNICRVEDISN